MSPVELLIDVPFDVGCFKDIDSTVAGDLSPVSGTPANGMTPAWCLKECVQGSKRFACEFKLAKKVISNICAMKLFTVIKDGSECHCAESVPLKKLQLSKESCQTTCVGTRGDTYSCGGSEAYSVYVAST